jgi:sec-independent protein translocase protein TatA
MAFTPLFISWPGGPEMVVIVLIILIVFGPKSLPKVGKAIGQGIREFKNASDGITKAIEEEVEASERQEKKYDQDGDDSGYTDEPAASDSAESVNPAETPAESPAPASAEAPAAAAAEAPAGAAESAEAHDQATYESAAKR